MKITTKTVALIASFALVATGAFANSVILTPGLLTGGNQGGEFTATSVTLSNASYAASARTGSTIGLGGSFETFCMAYDQEFSYSETLGYTLANHTSDPSAIQSLTVGTAYLYSQFAKGAITFTGSTAVADMTNFQLALWWLQQSPGAPGLGLTAYSSLNSYEQLVYNLFGGEAGAQAAAGTSNYGVSIIVTTHSNGTYSQPQLYYSVPDQAATLALLGLALMGLVGFRRRFAK